MSVSDGAQGIGKAESVQKSSLPDYFDDKSRQLFAILCNLAQKSSKGCSFSLAALYCAFRCTRM